MEVEIHDQKNQRDPRVAWEGCSVLLEINDGDRALFARLNLSSTVKIGNKKCSLVPLIGCPFGSLFQLEVGPKGPYLSHLSATVAGVGLQENGDCITSNESKDNRALVDDNKAQSLSSEDIDTLRREGATGDQIVEALIANSSTFGNKTSFSQEKYRVKKQKKYAPKVLMRRPSGRSICEAYFLKHPAKTGFLRMDALSILLTMGNVCSHSNVLVVDMVNGLLTGAVAERLGGSGCVCSTYLGYKPYVTEIVRIFNFDSETKKSIRCAGLSDLLRPEKDESEMHISVVDSEPSSLKVENIEDGSLMPNDSSCRSNVHITQDDVFSCSSNFESNDEETKPSFCTMEKTKLSLLPCSGKSKEGCDVDNSSNVKSVNGAPHGSYATSEELCLWKKDGFTSLIIAAPEMDPWSLVQKLLPLLSYSAPFAIYHSYLQPLACCMHRLQSEKMAINLQISEPWLREYQVLPGRTHPNMQMSSTGGYVLSGTRTYIGENG